MTSINSKQTIHFTLLLGILPYIADLSLFYISGITGLDFLFDNPMISYQSVYSKVFGAILGLTAIYFILKNRSYIYFLGLIPGFFYVTSDLFHSISFESVESLAVLTSIFSKIAFVIFIIRGNLRSLSFILFTIILVLATYISNSNLELGFFSSLKQSFLFVFFSFTCRAIYLWFAQNRKVFLKINKIRLFFLILKSIVLWSPILLFAIPQQYLSKSIENYTVNKVYETGYIKRHFTKLNLSLDSLKKIQSKQIYHLYQKGFYPDQESFAIGDRANGTSLWTIRDRNLRKTWNYIDATFLKGDSLSNSAKFDFNFIPNRFKEVFSYFQLEANDYLDRDDYIVMSYPAMLLENIIINKRYPGKPELELDAILSINEYIAQDQARANKRIDSTNAQMNRKLNDSKDEAQKEINSFIEKTNQLSNDIESGNIKTKKDLINRSQKIEANFNGLIEYRIESLKTESKEVMEEAPSYAKNTLDSILPVRLQNFIPYFKPDSCNKPEDIGWFDFLTSPSEILKWFLCRIEEMIKSNQRAAYLEFRDDALLGIESKTAELFNSKRQDALLRELDGIKSESKSLTSSLSNGFSTEVTNISDEANVLFKEQSLNVINQTRAKGDVLITNIQVVQDSINAYNQVIKKALNEQYEKAKELSAKGISATNTTLETNKLFGKILLLLIVFKSMIYVFSRVAFKQDEDLHVTLADKPKNYINGRIKKCGTYYSIPADHKETYFLTRKFRPIGRAPKVGIHCWNASIIKRILTGTYLMNHISVRKRTEESIDFRSLAGAEFIEWTLNEGEEVVFDYNYLVALTDTIKLSSDVSFRITSTLFGKTFFHIAKGPGKLVLMTKGTPLTDEKDIARSIHIDRLVAWQKTTEFSVISELSMVDMYLSGLYLKKFSKDLMIVDADETSKKRKVGIARFIGKFLFPT